MKRAAVALLLAMLVSGMAVGQFRSSANSKPSVGESLIRNDDSGLLFGWFDPSRLVMHQSYSINYTMVGGRGFSLGVYTGSLFYRFSNPLSMQFDVSLVHSPFGGFGGKFGQDISGIYLSRAQLNYRPSENTLFQIQFRQLPSMYWMNGARSWDFFGSAPQEEETH